jgi:hypothetical protein
LTDDAARRFFEYRRAAEAMACRAGDLLRRLERKTACGHHPGHNFVDFFAKCAVRRGSMTTATLYESLNIHTLSPNDVNSVTGFTFHEHRRYTFKVDFVNGVAAVNGAINVANVRGVDVVIQQTGHKVINLQTGEDVFTAGPNRATDEDFCRALAR